MKALIDGDIVLYSVGHATDERWYTIQGEKFQYKKDALKYCEDASVTVDQIQFHREPAPESFYYHALHNKIESILKATECEDYTVYLTGSNNFREDLAVTHKYKGNRDPAAKPLLYQEMKDYLMMNFNVEIALDREADDLLGINQTEDTVLCSTDKDLDQIPGAHYNWDNKELYYITEEYGTFWAYRQLLTGDWGTDAIIGCGKLVQNKKGKLQRKGVGPKEAEKLLKPCKTVKEMLCVVGMQYALMFDNPEDTLWEMAGLIEMHRESEDILAPGQRLLGEMYVSDNS